MQNDAVNHLLIGLPDTGKTTFLAALWHVVDSAQVHGALQLVNLEGDRTYLNKIRAQWMSCQSVSRTTTATEEVVSMTLKNADGSGTTTLFFPDMAGETFRLQWETRRWTRRYEELVRRSAGALVRVVGVGHKVVEQALHQAINETACVTSVSSAVLHRLDVSFRVPFLEPVAVIWPGEESGPAEGPRVWRCLRCNRRPPRVAWRTRRQHS